MSTAEIALPLEFSTAGVACGVKASGNLDLSLFVSQRSCVAAGVFTRNRVTGAPVVVSRERLPSAAIRGVVINSGNANACTGERGIADADRMTSLVAAHLGARAEEVVVCSTGVIGHFLPMPRIEQGISDAFSGLGETSEHLERGARGIMTTDTVEKIVTRRFTIGKQTVTVTGVAKGAAMIAPNMATMLAVVMTDCALLLPEVNDLLRHAVDRSFNCISVDGHTSTSDSVLLLANGASGVSTEEAPVRQEFRQALDDVCLQLSQKIIRDAEGAEHFVTVHVRGLPDVAAARQVAKAVCDSPLVKTAIAGNDPNWGRIVSAAGYSGVPFREEDLSLDLNGTRLYESGRPQPYDESAVSASMKSGEVVLDLQFRLGTAETTCWTSDLTAEYVRLNADYTT